MDHFGLTISPDVDTVCYTLAGIANQETGWGLAGETWRALEGINTLGGPTWFRLGDRDLGTHLERTRRLRQGHTLSQITADFCRAWGVRTTVLPMTDDPVRTIVETPEGELSFQEYFVHLRCEPEVRGFRFSGIERARPTPGLLGAIDAADYIVICPSNPWVSIDPILALPGLLPALQRRPVLAVSPIIGGHAVRGPAAKMYRELGFEPSALTVARHYRSILDGFLLDNADAQDAPQVKEMGIKTRVTDILMHDRAERLRLAEEVVQFGEMVASGEEFDKKGQEDEKTPT
jgi:LPPG:FO 2-phospho-L-lactate transferase